MKLMHQLTISNGFQSTSMWSKVGRESLTHSQLLEGLKCESQTKNNGRIESWSTLLGSQHFGGVEGRVGAPGWD